MIIQTLRIRNFRAYRAVDFLFGDRNLILGPNRAGKSSVVDALSYGFAGTCRGTDEGGRGAECLRFWYWLVEDGRAEPPRGGVEIGTDKGLFRRGIGDGPASKTGQEIQERLGVRPEALRAVFRPGSFLELPAAQQSALWAAVSSPADILPVAKEHLGNLMREDELPRTMAQVEKVAAAYAARRPELKRAIQEAQKGAVDLSGFDQRLVPLDAEALETTATDLRGRLDQLKATRDKMLVDEKAIAIPGPAPSVSKIQAAGEKTAKELQGMLAVFPGEKKSCPHCRKAIILLSSGELLTLEAAKESEKTLRQLLADAQKAAAPAPEPPAAAPTPTTVPPERQKIEDQIAKGETLISEIRRLIFVRQEESKRTARVQKLQDELREVEAVVAALAPKGNVRAALIEAGKKSGTDLIGMANRVLSEIGMGEAFVNVDPWMLTLGRVPATVLSNSEKLALNIAIQTAIAAAAGIRVLVIDEFQTFEQEARVGVTAALKAAQNYIDQVFVLASKSRAELDGLSAPEGWKLFRVQRSKEGVSELAGA